MLAEADASCSWSNISFVHSDRQGIPPQAANCQKALHRGITASPITIQPITMQSECCTTHHATAMGLFCCASTGWAGLTTDLATTARHSCGLWDIKPPGKMQQQGPSSVTFWMEVKRDLSLLCP